MPKTALIVIDIQNDYFADGAFALTDMEAAAGKAANLIERFRAKDGLIIHIQHKMIRPNPPFFIPGSDGEKIATCVLPKTGEPVVVKTFANAFRDTDLIVQLKALGVIDLVIVGAMGNNCVAATTRAATDFGFQVTVVHDACASASLSFLDKVVPSDMIHAAFMAALKMQGAQVVAGAELMLDKPEN